MRKFILEVQDVVAPTGQEYAAASYPGTGLYYNPSTFQWFLVIRYQGCTVDTVTELGKGARPPFKVEEFIEVVPEPTHSGITAADILKAIAISQNPLLAKELLR